MILVGLSGSGKSTVARLAADLLGGPWCDLDARVAATAGRSITDLFATSGEPAFRRLERQAMERALAEPPQVIAAGGGWAAHPGNLEFAEPRALTLYLCVTPEAAARRLAGADDRPLLSGDPLPRLREQLARRESWYRRAGAEIDGHGPAGAVAAVVAALARQHAGW